MKTYLSRLYSLIPSAYVLSLSIPQLAIYNQSKYIPALLVSSFVTALNWKKLTDVIKTQLLCTFFLVSVLVASMINGFVPDILKSALLFFNFFALFTLPNFNRINQIIVLSCLTITFFIPYFDDQFFLTSIYDNNNTLGIHACFALYLSIIIIKKPHIRFLYISFTLLIIYLTKSRSAYVFVLAFFFYNFFLAIKSLNLRTKKIIALILMIAGYFSYFILISNPFYINKLSEMVSINIHKNKPIFSAASRDALFHKSIEIIKKNPMGVGSNESNKEFQAVAKVKTAHNLLLRIAVDYGIIPLVLYLLIFFVYYSKYNNPTFIAFILAYHLKLLTESAFPFGLSISSFLVFAPPLFLLENFVEVPNKDAPHLIPAQS